MALIYPFDTTLNGHMEVLDINTGDLPFPLFVFPKGSFFVNNTYAIIKGTKKLLRPGVDYVVLSCNQDIPFSTNATLDKQIRSNYVRNAILLRNVTPQTLEWHVTYCGGEDSTKPQEYQNLLNSLHAQAMAEATVNYFTTKHQGWGVYASHNNTQIMQGKYIDAHYLNVNDEREQGKIGGLGWGKVELAFHGMSDVLAHGNDPLILEAFYNWILHNEIEFEKYKNPLLEDITNGIQDLNNKRVDYEQFIYTDSKTIPPTQKFKEHRGLILRGIDPNEADRQTTNPTKVLRKGIGFFSLAESGVDVSNRATGLLQRKADNFNDTEVKGTITFDKVAYTQTIDPINITVSLNKVIPTGKTYTLYVVSKELRTVIFSQPIATGFNAGTLKYSKTITYPKDTRPYAFDTLFAYVLDETLQLVNLSTAKADITTINNKSLYDVSINNSGVMLGDTGVAGLNSQLQVNIKRSIFSNAQSGTVNIYDGSTATKIGTTTSFTLEVGKSDKVVLVPVNNLAPTTGYIRIEVAVDGGLIFTKVMGYNRTTAQTSAYLEITDDASGASTNNASLDNLKAHYLKVSFAEDGRFHNTKATIQVTTLNNVVVDVTLGEEIVLDSGTVLYPLIVKGAVGAIFSLKLVSASNTLTTNSVNLVIGDGGSAKVSSGSFKTQTRNKNLKQYHKDGEWVLVFNLELNGTYPDGLIFENVTNNVGLPMGKHAMVRSNFITITTKSTRYVNEAITITMIHNGITFTANIPASTVTLPVLYSEVEHFNKVSNHNQILLNEEFLFKVTNPYSDRKLTLTLENYSVSSGITDITYVGGLATNKVFKNNVVIQPNETVVVSNSYIAIKDIVSDYPTTANAETGTKALFFPPYNVLSSKLDGTVIGNTKFETIDKYKVRDKINITALNVITNLPSFSKQDNVIAVRGIISGVSESYNIDNTITVEGANYVAALTSVLKASNNTTEIIVTLDKKQVEEITDDEVTVTLALNSTSGAVLQYVSFSLRIL